MTNQRGRSGLNELRRASSILTIWTSVCVIFLTLAVAGGGWLVSNYRAESKAMRSAIEECEIQKVAGEVDRTTALLQRVQTDLKYLLWGTNLADILSTYDTDRNAQIQHKLMEFCAITHNYDQICCFSNDGHMIDCYQDVGGELSKFGMSNNLQKQDLAYLEKIFKLQPNQLLISQIDLTGLYDVPSRSPHPFIRFGAPVFDRNGVLHGAVMLYYHLQRFLNAGSGPEVMDYIGDKVLLDVEGNWLVAPSQSMGWDDGFGQFKKFQNRFPEVWERVRREVSGQFYSEDGLFTFATVSPFSADALIANRGKSSLNSDFQIGTAHNWKLISWVSTGQLMQNTRAILQKQFSFYLTLMAVWALGLFWFARTTILQIRTEKALRKSEEQYRTLTESLPVGVYRMTVQPPQFVAINPALAKIHGFASVKDFLTDAGSVQSLYSGLCRKGKVADEEVQLKRTDGEVLRIRCSAETSSNETGEIEYVDGVVIDITQQKRAEEERAALQRLAHRLNGPLSAREIGKVVAEEARRLFQYDAFVLLLLDPSKQNYLTGYFEDTFDDSVGPVEVETEPQFEMWATANVESKVINRWEEPDETSFTRFGNCKRLSRSLMFVPVKWENRTVGRLSIQSYTPGRYNDCDLHLLETFADECSGAVARMWNREQRIKLEMQLREAQKMEAVGQLAGGIAHDFNNLLQAILGYTHMAMVGLSPQDQRRRDLEQIQKAGERAAALTRQLLAFGRRQIMQPERLDLNDVARDLTAVLQRAVGPGIDLQCDLDGGVKPVYADRSMIEQILLNLCQNSRDAMPNGGTITIATRNAVLDEAFCHKRHWAQPGTYSIVEVRDTGVGIPPEHLDRIFEPFFTTKEVGKGTGLGLSTVYGIIKQHHGLVDVSSLPDRGTVFTIYFPADEDSHYSEENVFRANAIGGSETILLVEDEDALRFLAQRVLEKNGYTVIPALDGEEAIRLYEEHCDAIHLVVLDMEMPKMNGPMVYDQLLKIKSNVRVLFCSGYDSDNIPENFIIPAGFQLVQKPYRDDELLRKVRSVLNGAKVVV